MNTIGMEATEPGGYQWTPVTIIAPNDFTQLQVSIVPSLRTKA